MMSRLRYAPWLALFALGACGDAAPDQENTVQRFSGISEDELVRIFDPEGYWQGTVRGNILTLSRRSNGRTIQGQVERFAGNNGLGYSGTLDGRPFDMAVTPGTCGGAEESEAAPYTVTIRWGRERIDGCATTGQA